MRPVLRGFGRPVRIVASSFAAALVATSALAERSAAFEATIGFVEILSGPTEHCAAVGHLSGVGFEPRLGVVKATSQDCINLGAVDPTTGLPTQYVFTSESVTLTLANGHSLLASYSGALTLQPDGTYKIEGEYNITGGTGRYHRAGGTGTISGVEDIDDVPAKGVVRFTGTLTR